ncbi:F-box only protein 2 isoform X2 [Labeo rohita]|uniref:F-box only protein 2 isoform X2 n=1 Tax=Labeo rohita TaxID=84645 RepID=UPI0021E29F02|nr:F-box only protein 2 isoform X2 [Labeo rohita]
MKRNFCGSTPTSECTKVSNKCPKKMDQNTRMDQSESSRVASRNFETSSDACSGQQAAIPLPMVEEIFMNLPAHQVVQVCRLVCHEWKELVDSAAHWRKRCKRKEIQPYDASRVPEDWRLFYFQSKYRRNLLKNPKADDGLQEWEFEHNCHESGRCPAVHSPPDVTLALSHTDCCTTPRTTFPISHCTSPATNQRRYKSPGLFTCKPWIVELLNCCIPSSCSKFLVPGF